MTWYLMCANWLCGTAQLLESRATMAANWCRNLANDENATMTANWFKIFKMETPLHSLE